MKRNILWMWMATICLSLIMPSCKDDDDDQAETIVKGAEILITAVFAPNQLGDNGYADCVMLGLQGINDADQSTQTDSLDISYISQYDMESTIDAMINWANNTQNPYTNGEYNRRLLILTENYMLDWIDSVIPHIRPNDEILVMKCAECDLDAADERLHLGNRLHGLNISAAKSARKFCQYMDRYISFYKENFDIELNYHKLPFLRLYPDTLVNYRDSIAEVLQEQLGGPSSYTVYGLSSDIGTTNYSDILKEDMLNASWYMGNFMKYSYQFFNSGFIIVDLGMANSGFDYYLFGETGVGFITLMLDAQVTTINRYSITRDFNICLYDWGSEWALKPTGEMPRMDIHGWWDNRCHDDLP